ARRAALARRAGAASRAAGARELGDARGGRRSPRHRPDHPVAQAQTLGTRLNEPAHEVPTELTADEAPTELTLRALAVGSLLGIVFAASSVYLALKVGLTVSASIPIAVLAVTLFRAFGRATILENNIVQTTGSAGESIAAGVAFTLPALLILGYDLPMFHVSTVALAGGVLG